MDKIVIKPVKANNLNKPNINTFIDLIYEHFLDLLKYPTLKHSKNEIKRLISNQNFRGYLVYVNNSIIGYLLGEIMLLNDKRHVFYISYIYVAPSYRNKGIASTLLEIVSQNIGQNNLDGILLTTDTEDRKLFDFYIKRGYKPDEQLRTYRQHEVLYLHKK